MTNDAYDGCPDFRAWHEPLRGTLMVTLLDAHSDIAMSYELYPALVETGSDFDLRALAAEIASARNHKKVAECAPTTHFSTFVARSLRGGLSYQDFARLLVQLVDEGHTLTELKGRMRLIELCGLEKMRRVGKRAGA